MGQLNGNLPGDDLNLPADRAAVQPGLDRLLGLLTTSAAPDELAGEDAALAMFRASQRPAIAVPGSRAPRRQDRRRGWLVAAVTVAIAAGFAVAAYTEALPPPVQHIAYRVLGFVGVPDAQHRRPASAGSHHMGPGPKRSVSPAPSSAGRSAPPPSSPSPTRSATPKPSPSSSVTAVASITLSVSVAHGRVAAGAGDVFAGRLTDHGRAVPGAKLRLSERAAGQPAWQLARTVTTGPGGRAVLAVSDLTTNASFRLSGPDGAQSQPVLVIVVPAVSVSLATGPHGNTTVLTVRSPLAAPGDAVVLQVWAGEPLAEPASAPAGRQRPSRIPAAAPCAGTAVPGGAAGHRGARSLREPAGSRSVAQATVTWLGAGDSAQVASRSPPRGDYITPG